MTSSPLHAGAATADITPEGSHFLFGYPHVARMSTGVHDRLLSSALCLNDGRTTLLFLANDIVSIGNESVGRVRDRIERATGVPVANMMITASHTHSGPMTFDLLSCGEDAAVPKADPAYVRRLEDGIVQAAVQAHRSQRPAEVGLAVADGSCVGGNRHEPDGPADPATPVLVVRDRERQRFLAAMVICSMHPTVLHEDSTLISGDFPAATRRYLQEHAFGIDCPVLHHTGPSGNQSPRHVTRANTFEEATRLGNLLGASIAEAIAPARYTDDVVLSCARNFVTLPERQPPSIDEADRRLQQAARRLDALRRNGDKRQEIRTAECDWFGAEENLALARAAATNRLREAVASVMPAEVTVMRIGPWAFVGWPGEAFVEFGLQVKSACPDCYVIGLANGELQGYLVTGEAVEKGWYEAMNAVFAGPGAGMALVKASIELLHGLR